MDTCMLNWYLLYYVQNQSLCHQSKIIGSDMKYMYIFHVPLTKEYFLLAHFIIYSFDITFVYGITERMSLLHNSDGKKIEVNEMTSK